MRWIKFKYLLNLIFIFVSMIITGCIIHSNIFYTPDILLKKDGQPCISIPANEDFFLRKKEFNILSLYVFQTGVGYLWKKNYSDSETQYYVKNQQCLDFNYHFHENIFYTVEFISIEKGDDEIHRSTKKDWVRYMRIIKKPDGTLQLLLDGEARDYS
ncbi:putative T6SS immunity periplasmic lipoprotein [Snodgrassella alvi]|uniref:putative T6SS immunity periplasmic lipoprotein n=1 Tax=Snodgrassella alvi TaxID=1196083 RepID=UPI003517DB38